MRSVGEVRSHGNLPFLEKEKPGVADEDSLNLERGIPRSCIFSGPRLSRHPFPFLLPPPALPSPAPSLRLSCFLGRLFRPSPFTRPPPSSGHLRPGAPVAAVVWPPRGRPGAPTPNPTHYGGVGPPAGCCASNPPGANLSANTTERHPGRLPMAGGPPVPRAPQGHVPPSPPPFRTLGIFAATYREVPSSVPIGGNRAG